MLGLSSRLRETVDHWGATEEERARPLPGDERLPVADLVVDRAVSVDAPAPVVFRWLCQIRVAPYSYDKLDNLGRQSPQQLVPGLEQLALGQRFGVIFSIVDFVPGEHITAEHRGPVFGHVVLTYAVEEGPPARLLMRIRGKLPPVGPLRGVLARALAAGDLVMARRQLLNLKGLAEETAAASS